MGRSAAGSKLKISDEGTTYYEVAHLLDINGPNQTTEVMDITDHQTPDGVKAKELSWTDPGNIELTGLWDPLDTNGQAKMWNALQTAPKPMKYFKVVDKTIPAQAISFTGYVMSMTPKFPVTGRMEFTATIMLTGKPTLAPDA